MANRKSDLDVVSKWVQADGPTNVRAIFSDLGVDYVEEPTPSNESGYIEVKEGAFRVVVNSLEGAQRRLFTAAHELGHYLMHRDLLVKYGRLDRETRHSDRLFENRAMNEDAPFSPAHEVQANRMAAQILMPASKVKRLHAGGTTASDDLAREFGVSTAAMDIRKKTLGLD